MGRKPSLDVSQRIEAVMERTEKPRKRESALRTSRENSGHLSRLQHHIFPHRVWTWNAP